jgi:hypothetical protein
MHESMGSSHMEKKPSFFAPHISQALKGHIWTEFGLGNKILFLWITNTRKGINIYTKT